MAKRKFNRRKAEAYNRRIDEVAQHLQWEFKRKGRPLEQAVDYAIRVGLLRQDAVTAARQAYGKKGQWVKLVQGGAVSPR